MQILRVFPGKRNQYTPDDSLAYCACGSLDIPFKESFPEFDEVHVSCCFTWDKKFSEELAFQLEAYGKPVKLGGVAFSSPCDGFQQGMYLHKDVTFTSRGCNNNCPWCVVPKLEGKLKEIEIQQGRIIQDNNFLQCSKSHKDKVFEMLKTQRKICFKGGLEVDLIDDHFINAAKGLRISEIWLACDTDARLPEFKKACKKLSDAGFSREKIRCYVLSYGKNMDKDESRARQVYEAGAMPFVQLYRDFSDTKTVYSANWNAWARMWQRPAALRSHVEKGTDFKNFRK